jgi:ketosteroid isomerase-like protein
MSVRDAIGRADFEAFTGALAPDVVWVGVKPGYLCRNREQVVSVLRGYIDSGHRASAEIVGETEQSIVVDPHVDPPNPDIPELHHVYVIEDDRIVEMRDYANRRAALEAVGL